ncbi:hypothetical protein BC936DRAFT_149510, partial [Jimgerdemannia flammicorona]
MGQSTSAIVKFLVVGLAATFSTCATMPIESSPSSTHCRTNGSFCFHTLQAMAPKGGYQGQLYNCTENKAPLLAEYCHFGCGNMGGCEFAPCCSLACRAAVGYFCDYQCCAGRSSARRL